MAIHEIDGKASATKAIAMHGRASTRLPLAWNRKDTVKELPPV